MCVWPLSLAQSLFVRAIDSFFLKHWQYELALEEPTRMESVSGLIRTRVAMGMEKVAVEIAVQVSFPNCLWKVFPFSQYFDPKSDCRWLCVLLADVLLAMNGPIPCPPPSFFSFYFPLEF